MVKPGLDGWRESEPVLRGERPYEPEPLAPFVSQLLPRNERRRATGAIKLALRAGDEILRQRPLDFTRVCSVFASSAGDGEIIGSICLALAQPERAVSPTQFHNSVHNGPVGYWAIATQCRMSSVSLTAHDGSFSVGLLEAATIAIVEGAGVLLVIYDHPPPAPISEVRCLCAPFAAAMLMNPRSSDASMGTMNIEIVHAKREGLASDDELERLHVGNPAARAAPTCGHRPARVSQNRLAISARLPARDQCPNDW